MKSAIIPQVRVEPELRARLKAVLRQGETLSEFVEASVRSAVEYRAAQVRFHARGDAAWANHQRSGEAATAEQVLDKLQARLDARREQLSE